MILCVLGGKSESNTGKQIVCGTVMGSGLGHFVAKGNNFIFIFLFFLIL